MSKTMRITKIIKFAMSATQVSSQEDSTTDSSNNDDTAPTDSPLDRSVSIILLAFAFLLPIFFFPYLAISVEFGKSIFIAATAIVALILWLVARLKDGQFVIPRSSLLASLGVVALVFFLATLFSPAFSVSFSGLIFELGTFAVRLKNN